ncbi:hypothetical protein PFICI_09002 [Pestalotiopsis fici W106-1]|uniref:Uncharacterized protein n=1 Tax=Pestalotiopsis fici (strain W106-1 / CGMCC3.15140) TaxID=1229662 RepID=W3WZD2_PESFW|nr:uncharacterized protein PFICI_09002 [Pestalotiopsis fici W106-1]ETS79149.1 hypothetical protein PFICI_09002 [Pestalotiopsis fici W106-1]
MDAPTESNAPQSAHESTKTTFTPFLNHHRHFRGTPPPSPNKVRTREKSPYPTPRDSKGRRRPPPPPLNLDNARVPNTSRRIEIEHNNVTPTSPEAVVHAIDGTNNRSRASVSFSDARKYGSIGSGPQVARFPLITPAEVQHRQVNWDGSSSVYSDNSPFNGMPTISPIIPPKNRINILQGYNDWRDNTCPQLQTPGDAIRSPGLLPPLRSKSVSQIDEPLETLPATTYQPPPMPAITSREDKKPQQGLVRSVTVHDLPSAKLQPQSALADQFSPLTPWVMNFDRRQATKNLFGDNGWLQDSNQTKDEKKNQSSKTANFFGSIKKMAKDLAENTNFKTHTRRSSEFHHATISLSPREQSLIYCELEYALSEALDLYVKSQHNGGRLNPDKLKAISDKWFSKGRPRVLGFRYDLETQLDLVTLHIDEFRFYGHAQLSDSAVAGLLAVMKGNARTMRVRHLAQPDAVVAKHILDAQALMRMLGTVESLQMAVVECSEFYKRAIERKQAQALAAERMSREA